MLGGGHGILQGQYGLLADQLIQARLVLANGSVVTVSNDSNPDLFWAVKGAGHNFGIVTEYTYRIYDARPNETWGFEQFVFTGDKIEQLYNVVSVMRETQPPQVVEFGLVLRLPDIDPVKVRRTSPYTCLSILFAYTTQPVIIYSIFYDGSLEEAHEYTAPIRAIETIHASSQAAPYLDLPGMSGNGDKDLACQKLSGAQIFRFPIYLNSYNVTAVREVYDAFSRMMVQEPAFNNSFFLLEGYSVQAVQKIPADSTAFAHRDDNLLL